MTIKIEFVNVMGSIMRADRNLKENTVFVWGEDGLIHENPEIIESEDDTVVYIDPYTGKEEIGRAVHKAFLTIEEAIEIVKNTRGLYVCINGHYFGKSEPTRRQVATFCYWYVKQRGTRFWGRPVTNEEASDLATGVKELRYYTNSRRSTLVTV